MTPLYIEINRWLPLNFVWGETDCMIVLGDWIKRLHGVDPVEDIRGQYNSALSCQRLTGFFTDPVAVVQKFADKASLEKRTGPAQRGDVGVLLHVAEGKLQPVGGLCLGKSWAVKAPTGATTLKPIEVLAAWDARYDE
jgi:hypothetical protein